MLTCKLCKGRIENGDEYVKDNKNIICIDCLLEWITHVYDIYEIAGGLCLDIEEYEEPEPEEKPEPEIPGQIDIFGNITT